MAEAIPCVNCGAAVSTPFCGACGQKNPPKKLNFLTLYTDFQSRIYGFDGMFPRTLRDLTIAPGKVAKDFVSGNRVRYVGPVGYFFLTLTVFLILMQLLEVDFYKYSSESSPFLGPQSERQQRLSQEFSRFVIENMRIFSFLQIPITTVLAWMFFRKSGYNFLEHSVFVFYVAGHIVWLTVVAMLLYAGFAIKINMAQLPIYWLFFAFGCTSFYPGTKVKSAVKGFLAALISFVLFSLLFGIAAVVYVLNDPVLMEELKNSPAK